MRWNSVILLRDIEANMTVDEDGCEVEGEPVDTQVFCNVRTVGF